ncbi:MAG: hypothetical protein HQ557_02025 [Bacteroidetes bacterium]|nr:hypothetical protein [Bacteroidota bacterium]
MNNFREQLNKKKCIGVSITFIDPMVSFAIADEIDFIWLDLEHSPMSGEVLRSHFLACWAKNTPAVVRVPGLDIGKIKGVLDSGANGIIVPQIRNEQEVETFLNACRYYPQGTRGYGPRVPSNFGRVTDNQIIDTENEKIFTAVMIENREAVQNLEAILDLDELDSIVIGPMDLSNSYGHPCETDHPEVESLIEYIINTAKNKSKKVGIGIGVDLKSADKYLQFGVDWIQFGCDYTYMVSSVIKNFSVLKNIEKS